jgi:hypothetical protein
MRKANAAATKAKKVKAAISRPDLPMAIYRHSGLKL